MKAALRKKNAPASATKSAKKDDTPSATVVSTRPTKRKALAEVETDENVPPAVADNDPPRPAKRARTSVTTRVPVPSVPSDQEDVKPKLQSDAEPQAFRPAMRVRKQYRARKGRTSSPVDGSDAGSKAHFVDYDALPSLPRAGAAATSSVRSTPPRKVRTKAAEALTTEAKNTKTGGKAKTEDPKVTSKADKVQKLAKPKTEEAPKARKMTPKTEKAEKAVAVDEMKQTKTGQDLATGEQEFDGLATTAAPRVPPRPRRVGGKDRTKENDIKQHSLDRPVRTSARAAAAAEKRLAQEKKLELTPNEDIAGDTKLHSHQQEDNSLVEDAIELPVRLFTFFLPSTGSRCFSSLSTFRHPSRTIWNRRVSQKPNPGRKQEQLLWCVLPLLPLSTPRYIP